MKTYEEMKAAQARIEELKPIINETMASKMLTEMYPEYTPEENEYFGLQKEVMEFADSHPIIVANHMGEYISRFATKEEAEAFIEANKPNDWFSFVSSGQAE